MAAVRREADKPRSSTDANGTVPVDLSSLSKEQLIERVKVSADNRSVLMQRAYRSRFGPPKCAGTASRTDTAVFISYPI